MGARQAVRISRRNPSRKLRSAAPSHNGAIMRSFTPSPGPRRRGPRLGVHTLRLSGAARTGTEQAFCSLGASESGGRSGAAAWPPLRLRPPRGRARWSGRARLGAPHTCPTLQGRRAQRAAEDRRALVRRLMLDGREAPRYAPGFPLPTASSFRWPRRSTPGPAILSFKRPSFTLSPEAVTENAETFSAPAPAIMMKRTLFHLSRRSGGGGFAEKVFWSNAWKRTAGKVPTVGRATARRLFAARRLRRTQRLSPAAYAAFVKPAQRLGEPGPPGRWPARA